MIGLSVFNLLVLLVVFGGVATVAFAVILNKESSNKPQPPQSNPYQQMPPAQQVPPLQQTPTAIDDAQPVEPTYFCAQCGSKLETNASFCQNCGAPVNHRSTSSEMGRGFSNHSPLDDC